VAARFTVGPVGVERGRERRMDVRLEETVAEDLRRGARHALAGDRPERPTAVDAATDPRVCGAGHVTRGSTQLERQVVQVGLRREPVRRGEEDRGVSVAASTSGARRPGTGLRPR
jgi:hypothetical protein